MKTMKKLMALTLVFVMAMALAIPSFAANTGTAGTDYDSPLKITGLEKGDEAYFYQVIKYVGNSDGNYKGWIAVDPFDDILGANDNAKLKLILSDGNINSDLAGELARAAAAKGGTKIVADNDGVAELANAEPGMWMALIDPANKDIVYNPVFISGDYTVKSGGETYDASTGTFKDAVAKKSELTLTKTGTDSSGSVDSDGVHTVAVGDVMSFTVTTTIPGYGEIYTDPTFELTDKLNGMTLNRGTVKVTTHSDGTYEVDERDDGYTITFKDSYLKTVTTPTPVTITYAATIDNAAAAAINQKDNEVTLKYSHNPNSDGDYGIKKDTTQHYTFTLDAATTGSGSDGKLYGKKTSELVKTGVNAAGEPIIDRTETSEITSSGETSWEGPLQDAVFGLYKEAACSTKLKEATTGSDGRMSFAGLDAGTYYLKEISAPAGFVVSNEIYKIDIVTDMDTVNVTETIDGKTVTYETEILKSYEVFISDKAGGEGCTRVNVATYTFTNNKTPGNNDIQWTEVTAVEHPYEFQNEQGVELPSTGGIGTKIFYALGAVLVIGAGVVLVSRKRALD